jgi:general secretion pathway protein G
MEMLVVVAIIVALAGLGGYYIMGQFKESQKNTALIQVKTALTQAVQTYALKHQGQYPGSLGELLAPDPSNGNQPYLKDRDALVDPWGNEYRYDPAGSNNGGYQPDIFTVAPDGATLGNWSARR